MLAAARRPIDLCPHLSRTASQAANVCTYVHTLTARSADHVHVLIFVHTSGTTAPPTADVCTYVHTLHARPADHTHVLFFMHTFGATAPPTVDATCYRTCAREERRPPLGLFSSAPLLISMAFPAFPYAGSRAACPFTPLCKEKAAFVSIRTEGGLRYAGAYFTLTRTFTVLPPYEALTVTLPLPTALMTPPDTLATLVEEAVQAEKAVTSSVLPFS